MNPVLDFGWTQWLQLALHYAGLSLLAVGGAITTASDMHRYLVTQQGWLSDTQFNASIAIAQAAPGPNVLFVALMGWHVGLNIGPTGANYAAALAGALVCILSVLLPSSTLAFLAARWSHANRELRAVRAFKQGLAPVVIALLTATGWVLASAHGNPLQNWPLWCVTAVSALLVWKTRLHLLWLLGAGALLGWFGLV